MLSRKWIEHLDASGRIYRKANEQYLPAFQAFWLLARDVSTGVLLFVFGWINAALVLLSGYLLGISGLLWLAALAFAALAVIASFFDAYSLVFPYYQFWTRTTHGSARWAGLEDLRVHNLLRKIGEPVPNGTLRIGRVFSDYDLILPKELWLLHLVFFGPTGAGKTKTFFMSMLRYLARHGSTIAFDPKGELYEQTAMDYRTFYRLDLINPAQSDRWNFMPLCRGSAFFANSIAGMMLSLEARAKTNQDPFWGNAEQVLLTAVLLHLAECYPSATPAFAYDFVAEFDSLKESERINELKDSPSPLARQAMQVVCNSAPENTLGSVLLGLGSKLRPFTLDEARQITALPTHEELQEGVKLIDFARLREPGTAVFIVVPEGATEVYKEFLATFFGQAIFQLRLDNTREPEHPCLVLIDEARELDVAEVRRIAGIGRGRGIGMALSYQDYPQVLDQYGDKGAKAILETMMTKIFLPGVNGETATYASDLLGKTTIHTETSVDYQGTDKDNTRYSEAGRALMLPDEIRQMPKFRQLLVVTDTAPPVKAAFPPVYLRKDIQRAVAYVKPEVLRLGNSKIFDGNFNFPKNSGKNDAPITSEVSTVPKKQAKTKRAKNKSVAVSPAGNAVAVLEPDSTSDQFEFESEITDRALDEIGERMADFETTNENGNDEEVLALADGETSGEGERDFMKQELKIFLTVDTEPKTPTQFESDPSEESGEVTDCFDSETVLRSREVRSSNDEAAKNQEITLTASVALTASEAAREKRRASQTIESEDEFYNALVQRVL
ncbi:MAG: type IV secretory system conjugative DNA transfer family protein [Acidobacteria bacterium]|jgi:type IV secretory pathway TraG/TraD family ATPase VirD4|nr:type IV secretory system conjugative DNA transfer family protein [Acidobacteriota bacterium]